MVVCFMFREYVWRADSATVLGQAQADSGFTNGTDCMVFVKLVTCCLPLTT